jgi:phospholipase C
VCGDLTSAFDFKTPNGDWTKLTLPSTADYLERVKRSLSSPGLAIPAGQKPTSQDGPQRPARPVPYQFEAHGRVADGKFWIDLANTGASGAVFQVYDNTDRQGPWRYTIESGKSHSTSQWHDEAADRAYDLSVHGPNGFFRQFRGQSAANAAKPGAEVQLAYEPLRGAVVLTLENKGDAPFVFEIYQEEIYPVAVGENRRRTITVAPNTATTDSWNLAAADHWYDITVTLKENPAFLRRFAGHLETGRASKTDPAIGPMRV